MYFYNSNLILKIVSIFKTFIAYISLNRFLRSTGLPEVLVERPTKCSSVVGKGM